MKAAQITGGRRQSGHDGLFAIAASLESVASSFGEGPSAAMTSPQRQTAAIEAIVANENLSENEFAAAVGMVQERSEAATAYLAIKNQRFHSVYLRQQLNQHHGLDKD